VFPARQQLSLAPRGETHTVGEAVVGGPSGDVPDNLSERSVQQPRRLSPRRGHRGFPLHDRGRPALRTIRLTVSLVVPYSLASVPMEEPTWYALVIASRWASASRPVEQRDQRAADLRVCL
jgi:hypothetical protein